MNNTGNLCRYNMLVSEFRVMLTILPLQRGLVLAIAVLLVSTGTVHTQPTTILDKTVFADNAERFYAETFVVPNEHSDSAHIVVMFRMANDFLTFTKASLQNSSKGAYQATMAVSVEVRDTLGVIRQRLRWSSTVYANTFEETNDKDAYRYGWQTVPIAPGSYALTLEVLDHKVGQPKRVKLNTVDYKQNKQHSLVTSPTFARPVPSKDRLLLRPFVLSGDIGFSGSDALALLQLADVSNTQFDYTIRQLPYGPRDIRWWNEEEIVGQVICSKTRRLQLSEFANTRDPFLEVTDKPKDSYSIGLAEINIPVSALVPGNYQLTMVAVGTTDTITVPFRIVWETMPKSLRSLDYAIKMLKFTATPSAIDSINAGTDTERRSQLTSWWRHQDPTPTTTFNERMAEYYKRVDQAFAAFSTIQEPDGADTERAKVYVLFGPPTTVEKLLTPDNEPQERWTYSNSVKKVFTFTMDSNGLYRLVNMEPFK